MATEIKMPQLSDTMDKGKILTWYKSEGEQVDRGDILAEVETDKANLEIECFHPGTLLRIVVPADSSADVGQVIAFIGEAGEEVAASSPAASNKPAEAVPASSSASAVEAPQAAAPAPAATNGVNGHAATVTEAVSNTPSDDRIKASPLAKSLATQKGIDLSTVKGSGPEGRIVKRDIEVLGAPQGAPQASSSPAAVSAPSSSAPQAAAPRSSKSTPVNTVTPSSGQESVSELSKMRQTIAKRMQQSVQEAPHFYTTISVEMDEAIKLKDALRAEPGYEKVSLNHFIIKACAYALQREPRVNCAMRDEKIFDPGSINIGIITALPDGLIIPVLHQVDTMNLGDVAFEARAAIERARAGRPSSKDLSGGTFSISNMGMFDVENFTAIINPGQGAVLAVSSTKQTPIVRDGRIEVAQVMKVTLSVDHRIIDGVMSGNFLKFFRAALETPALLMV